MGELQAAIPMKKRIFRGSGELWSVIILHTPKKSRMEEK